jgi:acetyl-CoA carboxylase biotin carboxyl carrier protein
MPGVTDWPDSDSYEPNEDELTGTESFGLGLILDEQIIDDVAGLIDEFGLSHVELTYPTFRVAFGKSLPSAPAISAVSAHEPHDSSDYEEEEDEAVVPLQASLGIPVTSPMTGIFYSRSNPGAPAFVQEGATVNAGQVVCLIEAMKVFNEITAPASGTVGRIGPKDGEVVQPGDVLITVLP